MEIKIVFSDIDGTFIRKDHSLSDKHAVAIKKLQEKGIPFILVSARMPEGIYPITDSIGVKIPVISYSGGLVLTREENVLYSKTIDERSTREVLDTLKRDFNQDISLNYYAGRKWYIEEMDSRIQVESNTTKVIPEITQFERLPSAGILPHKILILGTPTKCEKMEKELQERFHNLHIVRSSNHILDICANGISKATGIEVMLSHYGISREDALAFGDNFNDMEMLKYVGYGVAMGNAVKSLKKIANEVTESNEGDGIYHFLMRNKIIE